MVPTCAILSEITAAQREAWGWLLSLLLMTAALWHVLPNGKPASTARRVRVAVLGIAGLALLWYHLPRLNDLPVEVGFWIFTAITLISAVATISSRSPMYCAIWFAVTLLGTAGLMLLQGAQFLAIATVAVYAGAIVVTFLFVLMLSQPAGHDYYDRISWGSAPRFLGALIATLLVLLFAMAVVRPDPAAVADRAADIGAVEQTLSELASTAKVRSVRYAKGETGTRAIVSLADDAGTREKLRADAAAWRERAIQSLAQRHAAWGIQAAEFEMVDVQAAEHAAVLGAQLFSRQLVGVQVAGVLLLAGLVGAVAMAARGGDLEQRPT